MINKSSPDEICFSDSYILRILRPLSGLFGPSFGHLPTPQAYLSCKPLNNSFSHHPQVAKRKQRDQLSRVFDRANAARNGCEALWQWEKVGGPFYLPAQGAPEFGVELGSTISDTQAQLFNALKVSKPIKNEQMSLL